MSTKKRGLGKGLEALLGAGLQQSAPSLSPQATSTESEQLELSLDRLAPGPYQPRQHMDETELEALASSIRKQGVIQPILVKRDGENYHIVAGERRWRAAKLAGLKTIPVVVKALSDEQATVMALIENIQREDLNPIEQARALDRLSREFELTHQQVADAVGKSRVSVTHLLRLLGLPERIKQFVERKQLDMGHAKVLMGLPDERQAQLAEQIIAEGLSVRETEKLASHKTDTIKKAQPSSVTKADPDVARLEQSLSEKLGANIKIQHSAKGKGRIIIPFNSLDELEGVLEHIH